MNNYGPADQLAEMIFSLLFVVAGMGVFLLLFVIVNDAIKWGMKKLSPKPDVLSDAARPDVPDKEKLIRIRTSVEGYRSGYLDAELFAQNVEWALDQKAVTQADAESVGDDMERLGIRKLIGK